MYIGIDVGGTSTDAVLLSNGEVKATAKVYNNEDLLVSLLQALDAVMKDVSSTDIERVVLSTTVITNLIAERKYHPVGMLLMPGPGRRMRQFPKTDVHLLSGAIDYRGREIIPIQPQEVVEAINDLDTKGYTKVAVVGKFSPRNNIHELQVAEIIHKLKPHWQVELGHRAGGQLNFIRRVATTYYNCATKDSYHYFVEAVQKALDQRQIKAQVFIMKADAGTMPLRSSLNSPVETIFSGPAASTLGGQALIPPGETALVVDVGGTTTDLALILSGKPLLSSKGAMLDEHLTQVRTLAVKSVPVGGDSIVEAVGKEIIIYSERIGPPLCLGGALPTPTDALNVMGVTKLGDVEKSRLAMEKLGSQLQLSAEQTAQRVMDLFVKTVVSEIENMYLEWEQEPAYRIWEVMQKRKIRPENIVGVGGGAEGFVPQIAKELNGKALLPPYCTVANAIGVAVAKPTLQVTLRADTEQNIYSIAEYGLQGKIDKHPFGKEEALKLAKQAIFDWAAELGIEDLVKDTEVTRQDVFNIVRDMKTTGRIYDVCVQTTRGIQWHVASGGKLI